jgi:hypothetical protein
MNYKYKIIPDRYIGGKLVVEYLDDKIITKWVLDDLLELIKIIKEQEDTGFSLSVKRARKWLEENSPEILL